VEVTEEVIQIRRREMEHFVTLVEEGGDRDGRHEATQLFIRAHPPPLRNVSPNIFVRVVTMTSFLVSGSGRGDVILPPL
jgi:hypothetical protein